MRRRRSSEAEDAPDETTTGLDSKSNPSFKKPDAKRSFLFPAIIRTCCCLFVGWGVFLSQTYLFTSEECDMTYSHRAFLHLEMDSDASQSPYKLYKFYDKRDPLHYKFHRVKSRSNGTTDWCLNGTTTTAVLYIPGHGGSYQQSRSLGAHGLQLTGRQDSQSYVSRVQKRLLQGQFRGDAADLDDFVYSVYALDFAEEGGALHGDFLQSQAAFIEESVSFLARSCEYTSIVVVAHSIGGVSTRLSLSRYPSVRNVVDNVILLGSPQAHGVFAIDPSIHEIYNEITRTPIESVATVSVSGGLRDEMIPPEACAIPGLNRHSLSLMSVDIMRSTETSRPKLGMDHRAIVWCHNLLQPIREMIFILTTTNRDGLESSDRIAQISKRFLLSNNKYSFEDSVENISSLLRNLHGELKSIAIDSGFLYNADFLVSAYVLVAVIQFLCRGVLVFPIVPTAVGFLAWFSGQGPQRMVPRLILVVVADTMHRCNYAAFLYCIQFLEMNQSSNRSWYRLSYKTMFGCCTSLFVSCIANARLVWSTRVRLPVGLCVDCVLLLLACPALMTSGWKSLSKRQTNSDIRSDKALLCSLSFPVLFLMSLGELYHRALRGPVRLPILRSSALLVVARSLVGNQSSISRAQFVLHVLVFVSCCHSVAKGSSGLFLLVNGQRAGTLFTLLIIDIVAIVCSRIIGLG